jgi:hypothetical protein
MPIRGAFNQGAAPVIACINRSTVYSNDDMAKLVPALRKFLDECFVPIWGTPASLTLATDDVQGAWSLVMLDDADAADALGYHDLTKDGLPISKIFVKTTLAAGEKISTTTCHELAEMLVDPAANLWAQHPNGAMFAYEMCDACEESEFLIDGIAMSDFVTPAYFEGFRSPHSARFDYLNLIVHPFQIMHGGYAIISNGGKVNNVFGSEEKRERFAREDRRYHRSEYRKPITENLEINV